MVRDPFGEFVGLMGFAERFFHRNNLISPQAEEVIVEQLHAELGAGLNRRVNTERFVFANQVGDTVGDNQNLIRSYPTAADFWQQRLHDQPYY